MKEVSQHRCRRSRRSKNDKYLLPQKIKREDAQRYGQLGNKNCGPHMNPYRWMVGFNTEEKKGRILRSKPCSYICTLFITFDPFNPHEDGLLDWDINIEIERNLNTSCLEIQFEGKDSECDFVDLRGHFGLTDLKEIFKRIIYILPEVELSKIFKIIPSFKDKKVLKHTEKIKSLFTIEKYRCRFSNFLTVLFKPVIVTKLEYLLGK